MMERQQREGYTYEWLHTQVQHVAESPVSSNRRSDNPMAYTCDWLALHWSCFHLELPLLH